MNQDRIPKPKIDCSIIFSTQSDASNEWEIIVENLKFLSSSGTFSPSISGRTSGGYFMSVYNIILLQLPGMESKVISGCHIKVNKTEIVLMQKNASPIIIIKAEPDI